MTKEKKKGSIQKNTVQKVNGFVFGVAYSLIRIYCWLCGVHVRITDKVGEPERPSVILCNHGSFIDFVYAAALLRKYKPHFIIARLYFYNKYSRWLLKNIGGFPKSMFTVDMESTKNCLKVLKSNGILAMMPEARLSTTGRFEDIQSNTYKFLKKMGVAVYTVKFGGDYLADPKWGKGFRRGAVVEAEFDILYTDKQVQALSVEELKQGIEKRLYYNDFEWLERHPHIRYRSGRMAEGLENILTTCPKCKQKYTLSTRKKTIVCEHCGYLTSVDNRYGFDEGFVYQNLTQWYDWQKELLKKEIADNRGYTLCAVVELRGPGNGNGMTRHAGAGMCHLNREGLLYEGTKDGENVRIFFPITQVYRLLFGAGVNFEIYDGTEIFFFVPEEKRAAVEWYMASMILYDMAEENKSTE